MKQEQLILESWQEGLISRISSDMIPNDAMSECVNVDLSNKYIPQSIKGHQKYNPTEIATAPIKGGIVYNNSEDGEIIVVACGGFLWYAKLGTTTFTKYQIGGVDLTFDATVNVEMVQYNDKLYITNGKYPVISNTGYSTSCILVVNKYTPYVLNRTNYYAWSYSGTTYYTTSATPSHGDAIYSDTIGTASTTTVDAFTGGDTYFIGSDTHQYDRLATADKNNSVTPQGLRYLFIHQERLFGLSTIEDPNGIYWSLPYDPTSWTPIYGLNYDTVGKDDGEIITGGASFNEIFLYVFKKHNVYRYMTSGDIDQWASNKVDTDYGCVSHRTIKLFEGNLVYLSDNGVVKLNGNQAVLIDDAIRDKTTNVTLGSGVTVERSYTKEQDWDASGSSASGIITLNNEIKAVQNVTVGDTYTNLFSDYETLGSQVTIGTDNKLTVTVPNRSTGFESTDDVVVATDYPPGFNIRCGLILGSNKINKIKIFGGYGYTSAPNASAYINMSIYTQYNDTTPIATSENILVSDLPLYSSSNWITFAFSTTVELTSTTQYWIKISTYLAPTVYIKVKRATSVGVGTYYNNTNSPNYVHYDNYRMGHIAGVWDDANYTYVSQEFDTEATNGFDLQNVTTIGSFIGAGTGKTSATIYLATYDTAGTLWGDIASGDISTIDTTDPDNTTGTTRRYDLTVTGKRYIKFKLLVTPEVIYTATTPTVHVLDSLLVQNEKAYDYVSEPLRITSTNPNGWLLSTFGRTGTSDAGNLAKIYMRCAVNAGALASATYYELLYDTLINASMPFYQYVQFKVAFPSNSDNVVDTITVNFLTTETIVTPCAEVWKTKYILNMPENNTVLTNSIEYIYDKDGYWITKDTESNFIYFRSANNLFAGDITTGTIRYKNVGYTNDGVAYNCSFTTKNFALSDFENLFRKLKFRYQSLGVPITLSYSVDGLDYVDITIPVSTGLIETLHSLTGIVRGQTIQFKFSWDSDGSAEIHKLVLLWSPLRELNI